MSKSSRTLQNAISAFNALIMAMDEDGVSTDDTLAEILETMEAGFRDLQTRLEIPSKR
jgi:hypothetical protein